MGEVRPYCPCGEGQCSGRIGPVAGVKAWVHHEGLGTWWGVRGCAVGVGGPRGGVRGAVGEGHSPLQSRALSMSQM